MHFLHSYLLIINGLQRCEGCEGRFETFSFLVFMESYIYTGTGLGCTTDAVTVCLYLARYKFRNIEGFHQIVVMTDVPLG